MLYFNVINITHIKRTQHWSVQLFNAQVGKIMNAAIYKR